MIGPTAAALGLRRLGFSRTEAERLVALKLRSERGDFREVTDAQKRLHFVRWLAEHGRLRTSAPHAATPIVPDDPPDQRSD